MTDSLLVLSAILLEEIVGVGLRRTIWVDLVKQHLNSEQDFLDSDGWFPSLFFVEYTQADCARRIDVRMKKGRGEFAFWWFGGIFYCMVSKRCR